MTFPCTACGACCVVLPRTVPNWPLREDGACRYLNSDNRCDIYETRPDICRVGGVPMPEVTRAARFAENARMCNEMQASLGLDVQYRVVLDTNVKT